MNRSVQYARYRSICPVCGEPIAIGNAISLERSPKAKHWLCDYPDVTPAAPAAVPASPWQLYEGKTMTIADKYGYRLTGVIRHLNEQPYGANAGRRGWFIQLSTSVYGRTRRYFRELRETDTVVEEYAL